VVHRVGLHLLMQQTVRLTFSEPYIRRFTGYPRTVVAAQDIPSHTWLQTLEADLQPLSHGLNSAWRLAQARGRWRQPSPDALRHPA